MPIRRRSDASRAKPPCAYHEQMRHERNNQSSHERRQHLNEQHDPVACWCCCEDCIDLRWYYTPRKGGWWQLSPSGEPQLLRESCDALPGWPEIRTS